MGTRFLLHAGLVPCGLRGARGLCVTGGSPGSAGSRPRRDRPRRPDGPPKKARHNDQRREPSSRYSPQVSPWHTAAGTTSTGSWAWAGLVYELPVVVAASVGAAVALMRVARPDGHRCVVVAPLTYGRGPRYAPHPRSHVPLHGA